MLSEDHAHDESPSKFEGPRRYINNQVFENVSVQYVENVPVDIDGTVIYVVPENSNGELKACKGGRPWCKAQSSKIKEYTKGPRFLLNCRGSYICKNKNCKNIGDFGIDQQEFSYKNENVVCSVCGVDASYIRSDARLILERNVEKKIITCKHYGIHTCVVELKGRVKKDELKSISEKFPKLTREAIIIRLRHMRRAIARARLCTRLKH